MEFQKLNKYKESLNCGPDSQYQSREMENRPTSAFSSRLHKSLDFDEIGDFKRFWKLDFKHFNELLELKYELLLFRFQEN